MPTVIERGRTPLPRDFDPATIPLEADKYLRILFSEGRFEAEVGPYVGRLPLLDGSELTLEPKVQIEDIGYLILKAERADKSFWEQYQETVTAKSAIAQLDSLFYVHITRFLRGVSAAMSYGPIRRETIVRTGGLSQRGRPVLSEYRRAHPRTFGLHVPTVVAEATVDVPENRFALYVCEYLQDAQGQLPKKLMTEAHEAASYFNRSGVRMLDDEDLERCRELLASGRLPGSRPYYFDILEAGFFILKHAGFRLQGEGNTMIKPFVINMEDTFEVFIREVIREAAIEAGSDVAVQPGYEQPRSLYLEGGVTTEPDVVVYRGREVPLVLDAKYKEKPTAADHYQVLAYARAYAGLRRVALVTAPGRAGPTSVQQFNVDRVRVDVVPFNLGKIRASEQHLREYVLQALSES